MSEAIPAQRYEACERFVVHLSGDLFNCMKCLHWIEDHDAEVAE